jgi:HK97 family phage major capsid protein
MTVQFVTPQTSEEMLGESHRLFEEMKAIAADPKSGAEERGRIPKMLEDAKGLRDRAVQLKEIFDAGLDNREIWEKIQEKNTPVPGVPTRASAFKSWGDFLVKVWEAGHPNVKAPPDARLAFFKDEDAKRLESKDMSGASGAGGGFLIPAEFQAQLQAAIGERSIVRPRATIIPMRRRQLDIPVLDQTGTTSNVPHWFGGLLFYWMEEAAAKTESDAAFRQVSLVAHKLIGYTRASDELVDDSAISLEAFFSGPLGFAGGVAWMEDYTFLRGSGAGQPLGVINAGATIIEGRAAANAIGFDDICDMLEHALPGGRFVWVISQSAMSQLLQMNGPAGNPSYIWIANARDGAPGMLMGYPVIWSEKVPTLGTSGDIGLYDFSYYVVGDRQSTTVESTKFDRWSYDQTSWRVVHRVDGQPWLSTWLTLQDGSSTVSPFVILGPAVGS